MVQETELIYTKRLPPKCSCTCVFLARDVQCLTPTTSSVIFFFSWLSWIIQIAQIAQFTSLLCDFDFLSCERTSRHTNFAADLIAMLAFVADMIDIQNIYSKCCHLLLWYFGAKTKHTIISRGCMLSSEIRRTEVCLKHWIDAKPYTKDSESCPAV